MIYPWYGQKRWLRERYRGDYATGKHLIETYTPPPAIAYFRHSYASFRVNGFEYARLSNDSKKVRYGITRVPLSEDAIHPADLISYLGKMFDLLARLSESEVNKWAKTDFPSEIAPFVQHAIQHHQAEHWLESLLLSTSNQLTKELDPLRSQVVVGGPDKKKKNYRFIDILALDKRRKLIWVIELKAVTANKNAIKQAKDYAEWINLNRLDILDESNGYFNGVDAPDLYKPAVMFIAPDYTSIFQRQADEELKGLKSTLYRLNKQWRINLELEEYNEFHYRNNVSDKEKGMASDDFRLWRQSNLIKHIVKIARDKFNLYRRDPEKCDYINLCCKSQSGNVAAQIHKHKNKPDGFVLVIGNADNDYPKSKVLDSVDDYTQLSGDCFANTNWLRGSGKVYGHLKPAKCFFIPENRLPYQDIDKLLRYAVQKTCRS